MNHTPIRFRCPDCNLPREERITQLFESIADWVNSDALSQMVSAFGGDIPQNLSLAEKIHWLNDFAEVWDYRKKQAASGERWNITEDPMVLNNSELVMSCAEVLGLTGIETPLVTPNYILPLGGARRSNYARPLKAKEVIDSLGIQDGTIVALSGTRPINEIELSFLQEFAPDAKTEFDAISTGMEKCFNLTSGYTEEKGSDENINLCFAIRKYKDTYQGNTVLSLAAPSSDPTRRANSRDTFCYFLDNFNIKEGDRLLLVTTCIYVPFQLLRFMDLALDRGFYCDCIGMPNDHKGGTSFSQFTNYCQETKATINGLEALAEKYLR